MSDVSTQDTLEADAVVGYSDFEREPDGSVTAVAHRMSGESQRVGVRVSVAREHRRGGEVLAEGEVASSDVAPGAPGYVHFPTPVRVTSSNGGLW